MKLTLRCDIVCPWCDELIRDGERIRMLGDEVMHYECAIRVTTGGVNHQRGVDTCVEDGLLTADDPTLSRREAARAALKEYEKRRHT